MVSKYRKGRYYEYKIRDVLEKMGWFVIRAAKSAPIDLVAMKGSEALIIEVKKNGPKKAPAKFTRLLNEHGLKGIYVTIVNNLYWWRPFNMNEELIEEFSKVFGPNRI